jgi:hypothetical protein
MTPIPLDKLIDIPKLDVCSFGLRNGSLGSKICSLSAGVGFDHE